MHPYDIFEKIEVNTREPEFPIDMIGQEDIISYAATKGWVNRCIQAQQDYIVVKLNMDKDEARDSACKLLLAAAVDRNIIVYDESNIYGHVTSRLISLMSIVFRRNIKPHGFAKITDVYVQDLTKINDAAKETAFRLGIRINTLDAPNLLGYYTNVLAGTFPNNTHNLVLALNQKNSTFVAPFYKDKYGLAVLDNAQILLGAY